MKTNKALSLGLNFAAVFGLAMLLPANSLVAWLVAIQLVAAFAMARDKWSAQMRITRIPEVTLLSLAAFGGSPAVLAIRYIFQHKSTKQPFTKILYGISALQVLLIIVVMVIT